jgi:DNA-binding transcriptional regulator YdaS (Cro superfamily)
MKLKSWISEERGRAVLLARFLGIADPSNPALIYQWAKEVREVPISRCIPIETFSDGVVTRADLRPDDWHLIWPEYRADKSTVLAASKL